MPSTQAGCISVVCARNPSLATRMLAKAARRAGPERCSLGKSWARTKSKPGVPTWTVVLGHTGALQNTRGLGLSPSRRRRKITKNRSWQLQFSGLQQGYHQDHIQGLPPSQLKTPSGERRFRAHWKQFLSPESVKVVGERGEAPRPAPTAASTIIPPSPTASRGEAYTASTTISLAIPPARRTFRPSPSDTNYCQDNSVEEHDNSGSELENDFVPDSEDESSEKVADEENVKADIMKRRRKLVVQKS